MSKETNNEPFFDRGSDDIENVEPQSDSSEKSTPSNNDGENPNYDDGEDIDKNNGKPEGREHTRSKLALLFVVGFFAILFLCISYAININASVNDLKDIVVAIIGSLSGILGFIVGYYYKTSQE